MRQIVLATLSLAGVLAARTGAEPSKSDPSHFPAVMVGKWGTDHANCLGDDDYGPLEVSPDGFGHYEVSSETISIKLLKGRTYQLSYSVRDAASDELEIRKEIWTLSPDGNTLIVDFPDGSDRGVFSRCELLK